MRPGLPITFALFALPAIAHAEEKDLLARFGSSRASLTSYVGSGTFVTDRYSDDPLFTQAIALEPRFSLFDDLSVASGFELECELTDPDRPNARRCAPSDLSLSLAAADLLRDPWLNGQLRAGLTTYFPTSYESRFNHTIVNVRASAGYSARFFGDRLSSGLSFGVQKYLPASKVRGGGESGGSDFPLFLARRSAAEDGAVGSGGRMNDNWAFTTAANLGWQFSESFSAALSLGIYNYLRYSVADDLLADPSLPSSGRADITAGTLQASWSPLPHLGVELGVTSAQPALTADGRSLRFPFYDFVSPSNNFTRWYLAVHLTY